MTEQIGCVPGIQEAGVVISRHRPVTSDEVKAAAKR